VTKQGNTKSIYARLADARDEFHKLELTKSGFNKFAGYKYFELSDFLVPAMQCLKNEGLVPVISFEAEYASMTVHVADDPGDIIVITSPMAEAHLKGCHPIQNMGAVETYSRRYLWTTLMEVLEHDALDGSEPVEDTPPAKPKAKPKAKQQAVKTAEPVEEPEWDLDLKEPEPPSDDTSVFAEFEDEEGATEVADMMIELASGMHSGSLRGLVDFWKKNKAVIDALDRDYPDQYARVKKVFTKLRKQLEEKAND